MRRTTVLVLQPLSRPKIIQCNCQERRKFLPQNAPETVWRNGSVSPSVPDRGAYRLQRYPSLLTGLKEGREGKGKEKIRKEREKGKGSERGKEGSCAMVPQPKQK